MEFEVVEDGELADGCEVVDGLSVLLAWLR